jgi:hypothetical protein
MKKYKVLEICIEPINYLSNEHKEVTRESYHETDSLSLGLNVGSEVFEVIDDKETYLGVITLKKLVYICCEIASHSLDKRYGVYDCLIHNKYDSTFMSYNKEYLKAINARKMISLNQRWIEDSNSVSTSEFREVFLKLSGVNREGTNNASVFAASLLHGPEMRTTYAVCFYAAFGSNDVRAEYIKQCEFIVEFLKSNKNLFMD